MPGNLRQSAARNIAKYQSRTAKAIFDDPTTPGNLIVVAASLAGALPYGIIGPAGFTLIRAAGLRDLEVGLWYRQNAPATTSVEVGFEGATNRSIILRAIEYPAVAQSNALDRVVVNSDESDRTSSGATGVTTQGDELVIGIVANQYDSTTQAGFGGGLAKLFEVVSPASWSGGTNEDWERSRLSIHQAITSAVGDFTLTSQLSTHRRWVSIVATFRGGTTGPVQFTSTNAPEMLNTEGGSGLLAVFGPLGSTDAPEMLNTEGGSGEILPFDFQFRINGLLTGPSTNFEVVSHEGLYGTTMRTSDDAQPREDGELRGVDLQSARQVLLKVEIAGTEQEVEALAAELHKTLVPRRTEDFDFVWRHPGQPPRLWRCRPIETPRTVTHETTKITTLSVALKGTDPRHYGASVRKVIVPVTPAGSTTVTPIGATNLGNINAYPLIRVDASLTITATGIELVNITGDVTFEAGLSIPPGSVLEADMHAFVTGSPEAIVTLNGASKYGAWQQPREPFFLSPDPVAESGVNVLYLRTVPEGADVVLTLEWRDSYSG